MGLLRHEAEFEQEDAFDDEALRVLPDDELLPFNICLAWLLAPRNPASTSAAHRPTSLPALAATISPEAGASPAPSSP